MEQLGNVDGNRPVAIVFSANLHFVRPVRHFVSSLCALEGYSEDEQESIALVITEILNNSIEHGATGDGDQIQVGLKVTPTLFRFEVRDPGRGGIAFAAGALERAAHMPDLEEPRGRGLFLIRQHMDEMDVTYDPDGGTCMVVSKARSS